MAGKTFGGWPAELHDTEDQRRRIDSAIKAETTPTSIDRDTQTGIFPGSGKIPYRTSLQRCTCQFFHSKGVPCKHMYRLAMECGLFDGEYETGINKNTGAIEQIKWQNAVAKIEELPKTLQNTVRCILYYSVYHDNAIILIPASEDYLPLLNFELIHCGQAPLDIMLSKMKKSEIVNILGEAGIDPPKMLKADLIKWCVDSAPILIDFLPPHVTVDFIPEFTKARRSTYSFLNQRLEGEMFDPNIIVGHGD